VTPSSPVPVPGSAVGARSTGVSDEERNRYGVLLDHAAERGLLSPWEYQARLAELADAASVEELQRIVTELPAFGTSTAQAPYGAGSSPAATSVGTRRPLDPAATDSALWANLTPARPRRGPGNPWLVLAIVIVLLVVAVMTLALVAAHVAHARHPAAAEAVLSRLRL